MEDGVDTHLWGKGEAVGEAGISNNFLDGEWTEASDVEFLHGSLGLDVSSV